MFYDVEKGFKFMIKSTKDKRINTIMFILLFTTVAKQ